jgi:hypothetical protein
MNTDDTLASGLETYLPRLAPRDQEFARSLMTGYRKYGSFTDRQRPHVENLIQRATTPRQAPEPAAQVGDLAPLMAMFTKVGKRPMLMVGDRGTKGRVKLSLAGPESRNPGHLYVKVGNDYMGKVTPQGAWHPARETTPNASQNIVRLMREFVADPVGNATRYGRETGQCCFCARELTDPRSVQVGYGPDCADRWGLPWGA